MNTQKDQRQQRRGGFYWQDNQPYVSVTKVLGIIDKPALRYWFGREVYYAMVKDPALDQQAALAAPYQTSDKAKDRGTTVHSIVEAWKQSQAHIKTVPEPYQGYAKAFYQWVADNHIQIIEHEKTVINKDYGYAGTLDLIAKTNGKKEPLIIDVKTGKDIYPEAYLQLSAYKKALSITKPVYAIADIAVLLLKDDGKYKFEIGTDCFPQFIAAKVLWEWANKDMCKKVGYKCSEGGFYEGNN